MYVLVKCTHIWTLSPQCMCFDNILFEPEMFLFRNSTSVSFWCYACKVQDFASASLYLLKELNAEVKGFIHFFYFKQSKLSTLWLFSAEV